MGKPTRIRDVPQREWTAQVVHSDGTQEIIRRRTEEELNQAVQEYLSSHDLQGGGHVTADAIRQGAVYGNENDEA